MSKKKVTFTLEEDLVESLAMMATLTSEEKSSLVAKALTNYFEGLAEKSGKSPAQFMAFMKEAQVLSEALRPTPQHSQLPSGEGPETRSVLPGDESE